VDGGEAPQSLVVVLQFLVESSTFNPGSRPTSRKARDVAHPLRDFSFAAETCTGAEQPIFMFEKKIYGRIHVCRLHSIARKYGK